MDVEENIGKLEQEAALLARVRAGDRSAWAELLQPIRNDILPMVRKMVDDEDEAEDLVQQTLATMFIQMSRFRGEARLHTWAWQMARNTALKWLRRRTNCRKLLEENTDPDAGAWAPGMGATSPNPETLAADREALSSLREAFESLKSDERSVIALEFEIEEPPRAPNERVALHRARQKLLSVWKGKENER